MHKLFNFTFLISVQISQIFENFFSNSFRKVISKKMKDFRFFSFQKLKKGITVATDGHKMIVIISLFHQLFKNKFLKVCFIVSLLSDYQF